MKKLFFILAFALSVASNAFAEEVQIDGLWYNLSGTTAKVIQYKNAVKYSGDIVIPNIVSYDNTYYNVTTIGDRAFQNCSGLTSIIIPNSIATIGDYTFSGCIGLTSVTIGNGVISIGNYAFSGCTSLPSIIIPNSVTTIGDRIFQKCSGLAYVTIGNGVTSISDYAFRNCSGLMSIIIPNGVTTIGHESFSGCSRLASITIPESVTSIGEFAFYGCGIPSIHLPSTITNIGECAFSCERLVRVVSDIVVPPASARFFSDYTYQNGYLIVPKDAKFEYETTNGWKQFASIYEAGSVDMTEFTITVEQEGTLSDIVEALETQLVENLTIKGRLNGKDIAFLVSQKGKVAHLYSLDLKDVTLVSDNTMYQSDNYGTSGVGMSTETVYYYLSDGNYKEEETGDTGLGGIRSTIHYYNNHLAGAFHDMNLRKIVMPASITQIGERTFKNNAMLEEVWFPESVKVIGGGRSGNAYSGAFYDCYGLTIIPSLEHVENIEEAAFAYCANITGEIDLSSVRNVKESAFYACSGISSVKFSGKLESVDTRAFEGCSALSDISFDENTDVIFDRTSFSNTPWNEKLPIENGIVYMGKVAMSVEPGTEPRELTFREGTINIAHNFFDRYTYEKIRTINLPNSIKRIGNNAFYADLYYGSNIEFINFPEGLLEIGSSAFSHNKRIQKLALPNSLKYIGARAFASMEKLQSVKIGSNVETLSESMFASCEKLVKVEFEERNNSLPLSIEKSAFWECSSLTSVTIPNSVTSIGSSAFYRCSGLTSVTIGNSVTSIGSSAFSGCSGLTSVTFHCQEIGSWFSGSSIKEVTIGDEVESIGDYAFSGCSGLTSVTIGNSVTSIGSVAFQFCSGLTSVTIGNSVTSIGAGAFYDCSGLTSVTIPNSVTSIGSTAFKDCSGLTSVTIPNSVTSIGSSAFYGCSGLNSVTSLNPTPPSINSSTFKSYTATLKVPKGSKAAYQTADYWKEFTNINEIDVTGVKDIHMDNHQNTVIYDLNGRKLVTPTKGVCIINGRKVLVK